MDPICRLSMQAAADHAHWPAHQRCGSDILVNGSNARAGDGDSGASLVRLAKLQRCGRSECLRQAATWSSATASPCCRAGARRGDLPGLADGPTASRLLGAGLVSLLLLVYAARDILLFGGMMLMALLTMLGGWNMLRQRSEAPDWFARHFALVFYGAVTAFGLLHVSNYDQPGLATLPMVLPQLWCGAVLGYVRMRIGLPAAILLHALSNSIVLAIALGQGQG
jgi:Type II CAAX prenyl endopeptidase Rce1-like